MKREAACRDFRKATLAALNLLSRFLFIVSLGCGKVNRGENERVLALDEMNREQRLVFLRGHPGDWRQSTDKAKGIPAPSIEKPWPAGAQLIELPPPNQTRLKEISVRNAISQRRSRREYSKQLLSLQELSWLLWACQGIEKIDRRPEGDVLAQYRTVPSAGARHPFETYLSIHSVEGLKPGLYRYLPLEHKLLPIRYDERLAWDFRSACYGQDHVAEAAVVFVWVAIPYRTEWAYGFIAPKLIAVDAGHVCQNLYLAAEAIESGVCAILGYDQKRMDALLCLDGKEEFVIYLATVGKTTQTSKAAGLPNF